MNTFKAQLLADKKKTIALGVLASILLVVVGRAVFSHSPTPEASLAAPVPAPSAPLNATTAPPRPIVPPSTHLASADTSKSVLPAEPPKHRFAATEGMPRELDRDVFSAQGWLRLPPGGESGGPSARSSAFWQGVVEAALEYRKTQREQAVELAKELSGLTLQSTLTGNSAAAYVSGRLVHEGDSICGFSVVRIEERRVILAKLGHEHALTMP